jgi:stage IV sporulation protein B
MADYWIPDTLSVFRGEEPRLGAPCALTLDRASTDRTAGATEVATVRLFGLLPVKRVEVKSLDRLKLCPGGDVFGIRAPLGGALVTSLSEVATEGGALSPAREAGLRRGDLITAANGKAVGSATELSAALSASAGARLSLTVLRGSETLTLSLTPALSLSGAWRAGIMVKDSVAGIGTVTFVDPETGFFGGLGHGVYDGIHETPVPISRGTVTSVGLSGVRPGAAGDPGELRGHLNAEREGVLLSNPSCGVFGVLTSPAEAEAIPIGLRGEVSLGRAEILSTVDGGGPRRYTIEITALRGEKGSDGSFSIRVTDPALLEKTGGIVQGMSGSPIIQNGKLVGAVTHVMINDPTAGYGIFIENMLSAAEAPMAKAS